jgi:hypothetical protein
MHVLIFLYVLEDDDDDNDETNMAKDAAWEIQKTLFPRGRMRQTKLLK